MFKHQTNLILGIIVSTSLNSQIAIAQTNFKDVPNEDWNRTCIGNLADNKILGGYYEDNTFRPTRSMTRAEFAAIISRAFPKAAKIRKPVNFLDVPTDYWGAKAIQNAYEIGFMSGYNGSIFNPTLPVTRLQVILALSNGLKLSADTNKIATLKDIFVDADTIPEIARKSVIAAAEKQLIVNYPTINQLNPNQNATRSEVAAFLCQTLAKFGENKTVFLNNVPPQFIAKITDTPDPTTVVEKQEIVGDSNFNIELKYNLIKGTDRANNFKIKVSRSGKIVLDQPIVIPKELTRNKETAGYLVKLKVQDLDGDKEPEILLDLINPEKVDCCLASLIYKFDSATNKYNLTQHFWSNVNYELVDLDSDNIVEFFSKDGKFTTIFNSKIPLSVPLQIWQYRQGKLNDVTSKHPIQLYTHAAQLWLEIVKGIKENQEVKGLIAAFLAEKYLLNQEQEGWDLIKKIYVNPDRTVFFQDLQKFLQETGYSKKI